MKRCLEDRILGNTINVLMIIAAILTIYPLYYSLINSFNSGTDLMKKGFILLFPRAWTLDNYYITFREKTLLNSIFVTVARTIIGTVTSVFFTAMVSYPLSKKYLSFRKLYLRIGVITMYFWGGLIPTYILLNYLHMIDKFIVYIIPMLFSFFNAAIFINFFNAIPESVEESAKIDGANDILIFLKIVIPLSTPVIATISLFNGVNQWNSWFDSAFFTSSPNLQTLQCILWRIVSQSEAAMMMRKFFNAGEETTASMETVKFATMVVSIVPIIFSYPFLQRYFIKGIMMGSLKG